jgi:hypothetical protein
MDTQAATLATPDQAPVAPPSPPPSKLLTVPIQVGGRTVSAYVEANDEASARTLIEGRRQRLEELKPQSSVWAIKGQAGGYGFAYDAQDETTARAQVAPGLANQDAIARFTADQTAFDNQVEDVDANIQLARLERENADLDAMIAESSKPIMPQIGQGIGAVAKDVSFGLGVEGPKQIVAGLASGINEIGDTIMEVGTALTDASAIPLPYVSWQGIGDGVADNAQVRVGLSRQGQYSADVAAMGIDPNESPLKLPVVADKAETVTGNLVRGISQFAAGLGVAGKALQGWKAASTVGRGVKALVAGAAADFSAFDQADDRLSDLVQSVPALRNPVTEWLAGDEDDAALEGRLKNAIEGGIIGLGFEAVGPLVKTLSAYRQMKKVQPQVVSESQQALSELVARAERTVAETKAAMETLGKEDEPLVQVVARPETPPQTASSESVTDSVRSTSDITIANQDGEMTNEWEIHLSEALTQAQKLRDNGLLPLFHGTSGAKKKVNPNGMGLTFFAENELDAARYAGSAGGNRLVGNKGRIEVQAISPDAKLLDATNPEGLNVLASLNADGRLSGEFVRQAKRDIAEGTTNRFSLQFWTDTKRAAGSSADDILNNIAEPLRKMGYAGLKFSDDRHPTIALFDEPSASPAADTTGRIDAGQLEAEGLTRTADAVGGTPQRPQDTAQAKATGDAATTFGANPFKINFAKIANPDDINSVIAQMVEARPEAIDAARRGIQSWDQSVEGAASLMGDGEAFQALLTRRPGAAANDQETTALRMLWGQSAEKLRDVARMASESPTDANLMAFRQMMTTHGAIEETVMGARAEAGRALQVWRMPVGSNDAVAARVSELIGQNRDVNIEMARKIATGTSDSTMGEIARRTAEMTTAQKIRTVIQASMLTNPSTHVANVVGNGMATLFETSLRALAPRLSGGEGVIEQGEAAAMLAGQAQAFWDLIRQSKRAKDFISSLDQTGGKAELEAQHMFPKMAASNSSILRSLANVGNTVIMTPGKLTSKMDDVFKFAATSASLNASAFRQAMKEVAEGSLDQADAVTRQRELVQNPTPEMLDEAHRLAEESTFTNSQEFWADKKGTIGPGPGRLMLQSRQMMERGEGAWGLVGGYASGVLMPFVNTPANIMSYAFRSSPLAPMMKRYQKDMAAGGARAEIAKTRMIAGSSILWSAFSLATEGHITGGGPIDPEQRQLLMRQGWQPYSLRIGDKWYSYNRLDPLGTLLSVSSDVADMALNTDWEDFGSVDQWSEVAGTAIGAIGMSFLNKSMLTGTADLFEFMGDPKRYGENFLQQRLAAPVPAVLGLFERLDDPFQRDPMVEPRPEGGVNDILSGLESFMLQAKNRVPGLSATQPIKRDMWGRPVQHVSGMGTAWEILSPSRVSSSKYEPIDGELANLRYYPAMPRKEITLPKDMIVDDGDNGRYSLSDRPDIYNRILELRGEMILPKLNAMVQGEGEDGALYVASTDAEKEDMIKEILSDAGKVAREQVIQEFYQDFSDMAMKRGRAKDLPPIPEN